jgi:hypothetical protein
MTGFGLLVNALCSTLGAVDPVGEVRHTLKCHCGFDVDLNIIFIGGSLVNGAHSDRQDGGEKSTIGLAVLGRSILYVRMNAEILEAPPCRQIDAGMLPRLAGFLFSTLR